MSKRGQLKLSFGMIFSIILIIAFFAFAFYVIPKFLDLGDELKTSQFFEGLQKDVDKAWQSTRAKSEVEYLLSSDIKQVCFEKANSLQYVYVKDERRTIDRKEIDHLDTNDGCIPTDEGKISFYLEKDYGENVVGVTLK